MRVFCCMAGCLSSAESREQGTGSPFSGRQAVDRMASVLPQHLAKTIRLGVHEPIPYGCHSPFRGNRRANCRPLGGFMDQEQLRRFAEIYRQMRDEQLAALLEEQGTLTEE